LSAILSDTLYHLVGFGRPNDDDKNAEILSLILTSMTLLASEVDGKRGMITMIDPKRAPVKGEPIEQSVVCLCDIPFENLAPHAAKYGRFGIGVCRSVFGQWGGRPVIYIPTSNRSYGVWGNRYRDEVMNVWHGLTDFFPNRPGTRSRVAGSYPTDKQDAVEIAQSLIATDLLAYMKVFDVDLPLDDPNNFYTEREWRKHADLNLAPSLRTVIAPPAYLPRLKKIVEGAEYRGFSITGPVAFLSLA
jgi:hypothetical protein